MDIQRKISAIQTKKRKIEPDGPPQPDQWLKMTTMNNIKAIETVKLGLTLVACEKSANLVPNSHKVSRRSIENSYRVIKQIGLGTFGDVFKAFAVKCSEMVALKKIHVHIEKEGFPITALREVRLLKKLGFHQNIVNLKETVPASFNGSLGQNTSFMVFEYVDYDLTGILENKKVVLDDGQIKNLMKQLLEGISITHFHRIIHRDLKCSNLLLDVSGCLKIADWGLARNWTKDRTYTNETQTLWYRSPELLLGQRVYDMKIDMWSVGCIFAEFLTRKCVFPGKDEQDQLERILNLCGTQDITWPVTKQRRFEEHFKDLDPNAKDLLKNCLTIRPEERISSDASLDHDFFWAEVEVDSNAQMIRKIRNQIGHKNFDQGMHEFELRQLLSTQRKQKLNVNVNR